VQLQGGDLSVIDDPGGLRRAKNTLNVASPGNGYVTAIACEAVGTACVILGGGREKKEDSVDPAVGMVLHKKVGDPVKAGEVLCTIHHNSESRAARAKKLIEESYRITGSPPAKPQPLVRRVIQRSRQEN
jgi:pyrimidine-nucleoside phosphorylase